LMSFCTREFNSTPAGTSRSASRPGEASYSRPESLRDRAARSTGGEVCPLRARNQPDWWPHSAAGASCNEPMYACCWLICARCSRPSVSSPSRLFSAALLCDRLNPTSTSTVVAIPNNRMKIKRERLSLGPSRRGMSRISVVPGS
jgi:hypothetical protein